MIDKALTFITNELNKELKMAFSIDEDRVVASSLINPDGSVTENIENKVIVSIINIEHETGMGSMNQYLREGNEYSKVAAPVYLNLYLLVSANYDSGNYLEANKMLSAVIKMFQANPYYTKNSFPSMQLPLEKLTFEIFNLPISELSHIWSGIGAKYVPSIIYKVRMMTVQEEKITKQVPGITGLDGGPKAK